MCSISYNAGKFHSVTCKIHTHTHKAHHKYAFVPLLFEMSPGNILNVTLYIFISLSLALRGGRAQQEARVHHFMIKWRHILRICSTFLPSVRRQKDDKCWRGWRWVIQWSRTDRWWDRERESWEKNVMVLALSSTPLLQSPRQHAWRALKRGVITDKNNREAESEWEKTRAN